MFIPFSNPILGAQALKRTDDTDSYIAKLSLNSDQVKKKEIITNGTKTIGSIPPGPQERTAWDKKPASQRYYNKDHFPSNQKNRVDQFSRIGNVSEQRVYPQCDPCSVSVELK